MHTAPASTVPREAALLRATGAIVAMLSGPMWAVAITRSVVEMDRDVIDRLDDSGRAVYGVYWLTLTALMFFGASLGYFALRSQHWPVLRSLRLQQFSLLGVSAAAVLVATLR